MPRIAPVSMTLGTMVGTLFTRSTVGLVTVTNLFYDESSGLASVPIAANGGLAPPQAG